MRTAPAFGHEAFDQEAFGHEAFLYRGEEEFLGGVVPFVREGLERGERVVVAEPPARLGLLRDALAADGSAVRFLDMTELGGNPARIIPAWAAEVAEARADGRALRGVGEPAYAGRRPQELDECHVHELLLNRVFDGGLPWRLLCPYDSRHLPARATDRALLSHPAWSSPGVRGATGADLGTELTAAFAGPLLPPAGPVLRGEFAAADVPAVRHTVASWARRCGLADDQVEVLELAATELAANSIRHGSGAGSVAMWEERRAVVVEFRDAGLLTDPLAGRLPPGPGDDGCSGLYLLNQLCDLLQLRTGPAGTTARVTTWR